MIKSFVTGAAAIAVSALAPLSVTAAPVYFNPEVNIGADADNGVGAATAEFHLGETEVGVSGKAGYGFGPGYTELSFTNMDSDTTFNLKVGGSFDL
mgnify:CR=1 FL=1